MIQAVQGDITQQTVDAIVNAANNHLRGGGGVDGAIHRAAGPGLLAECVRLNGCATGMAKLTAAHDLPCQYIIHTVGPVWQGGVEKEAELLSACYLNSLRLAVEHGINSIAFPAISCGVYGYPHHLAVPIAVRTVAKFIRQHSAPLTVRFVNLGEDLHQAYLQHIESSI